MTNAGQIPSLSEAELDALPRGVIRLDRTGRILYYSPIQAQAAHRSIAATVGLNFFSDVAPCTAVKDFQGRFNDFVDAPAPRTGSTEIASTFNFKLKFGWGSRDVLITMVKTSGPEPDVYIVVDYD